MVTASQWGRSCSLEADTQFLKWLLWPGKILVNLNRRKINPKSSKENLNNYVLIIRRSRSQITNRIIFFFSVMTFSYITFFIFFISAQGNLNCKRRLKCCSNLKQSWWVPTDRWYKKITKARSRARTKVKEELHSLSRSLAGSPITPTSKSENGLFLLDLWPKIIRSLLFYRCLSSLQIPEFSTAFFLYNFSAEMVMYLKIATGDCSWLSSVHIHVWGWCPKGLCL